uniref:Mut7-C RNAse domain-containing protein n=1 Tax=Capra hircus TaxID=9925 RepID=A0A452FAV5_CAPHI
MCAPLLLQDKVDLTERYVDSSPLLQQRLLALMDSWCQPGFDIRVVARQYPQATLRLERLSPRALGRQVLRLLEQYRLGPALCPNVVTQQRLAALRYLCYKRLVERSISRESWAELVQGLVGQDECLQGQLLRLLASQEDVAAVAQCALDLSLPEERLPATVVAEMSQLRLQERTDKAPSEDRRDDCYRLPIAREDIHFLASWEELARHEDTLLQPGQVVGVDLEWRPSFGAGGRPRVSLMQVAVEGRVFLLDLPQLSSPAGGQAPRAFSQLVSRLLSDPSITKLGYGMAGDLRSLGASYPALAQAGQQLQGCLDLLQVHRQVSTGGVLGAPCSAELPTQRRPAAVSLRTCSCLVPARAFRVVCDSMLGGLGRTLRCLGVDVRVLHSGEHHRQAAEVARQEGRVILTSGLPYHKLRAQVGAGRCLAVDCSLKAQQQAKAILRHFNVRVTPADIFSRCQACNCDRYLKVSKDVMKQLVRLSVHLGGPGGASTEGPHSDGEQEAGSAPEEAPGGCSYDPPCRWLEDADLQTRVPATLASGTQLQLAGVPAGVLRRPGLGHSCCCSGCGSLLGRLPPGPSHQQLPRGPGGRPPPSQRPLLRAGPGPPGVNMPTLHRWGPRAPSSGLRSPLPRARQPLAA